MKTKLKDNEVKEVARMQQMIDSYEGFIKALFMMMLSKREINYPQFSDTNLDEEMNKIWRWVKEHIEYKNENANNNSLLKMLENSITDEQRKLFEDSFIRMIEDSSKRKRHIIAYLYLWVSVMENITLREAFERYAWKETPCERDTRYHITDVYTVLEKFEAPYCESTITLIPIDYPSECKMPYREAALEMVELFKEILHIP